jgi:hypothetical protein
MSTVHEIKQAIRVLTPQDCAVLRECGSLGCRFSRHLTADDVLELG